MSKKQKGRPTVAGANPAVKTVGSIPTKTPVTDPPKPVDIPLIEPSFQLIRFDKRVKWFLRVCAILFVLLTVSKIHPVSLAIWNQLLPDGGSARRGLISGEPRQIRMDDYAVSTPWLLSQVNNGLPDQNETIGGEKAPVLVAPAKHFSQLFKPQNWGFFFLDSERAYAWTYSFFIVFALIGASFMFLLLTRNNFWLSILGGVWLLLSSGTQSWVYGPAVMIGAVGFMFVAIVYLIYSSNWKTILVSAIALAWLMMVYALILYPPYQVPLSYVLLFLLIGYVLNNWDTQRLFAAWPVKAGAGALTLALAALAFMTFYTDIKPTLDAVMNTVYPGKRSELGGTGFIGNWFSEYFSWQMNDRQFPAKWLNHCELSHFITFTPIIIPAMIVSFWQTRRIDWVLVLLSVFVIIGYIWIEIGFPEWLAKASLWSMSPTRRTQIPFGIANVLLAIVYLYFLSTSSVKSKPLYAGLGFAGVVGFMIYAALLNIGDSEGFFKWSNVFIPMLFFVGMGILLLPTWQPNYRIGIFCAGMTLFLMPNLRVNPVAKGLSPITEHALYRTVQDIHQRDPNARWVVNGSQYISYLVTATGVKLLSGVKYVPERKILKVLDPQMKRDSAYNRYAHTVYNSFIDPKKPDSVIIFNNFEDGYLVAMDPCSPRFKTLNVKYVIFDKQPQPVEIRCMKEISVLGGIHIYQMND
ncbi:DUF7657 domain-containing protein [Spirosoma aerophilum]